MIISGEHSGGIASIIILQEPLNQCSTLQGISDWRGFSAFSLRGTYQARRRWSEGLAKWISEWVLLSLMLVLGAGLLFVLCAVWSLLRERLPAEVLTPLSTEGVIAMGMLLVVTLGFGKLISSG